MNPKIYSHLPTWHPVRKQLERRFSTPTRRAPSHASASMKDAAVRIGNTPHEVSALLYANTLAAAGANVRGAHWVEIPQTMTAEMKRAAAQSLPQPHTDLACKIFYTMLRAAN